METVEKRGGFSGKLGFLLAMPSVVCGQAFDASTLMRAQQNGNGSNLYGNNPFEQPDEEAVPEEPAGDAAEDGADAETDAVALPTAEQFREAFAEAFDTLWREMYAAALEAPAETVPDAALSPDGPGIE